MTQDRRYFGTDGIRGRVGEEPITAEFALRLGRAAGCVLGRQVGRPRVLIGKDTRVSGYLLESALEAGLAAAGADVLLLGPMPTPAVAFLTRSQRACAGIVVSASHNPYEDNGIKFFSASGEKLEDAVELAIEEELERPFRHVQPSALGKAARLDDAQGRYLEFLKSRLDHSLDSLHGMRIVVDAAHGAAYRIAPQLFEELGLTVHAIGSEPDGFNINAECGATDPIALRAEVQRTGAALGIALDGDGDRVVMIGPGGRLIDGDDLVYLLACDWRARGLLRGPVVGTVMTNLGIEHALAAQGIAFERAAVGDRHVHQRLKERDGILGGEASGHVICRHKASTGDGLMTALLALEVVARSAAPIEASLSGLRRYPQRTVNLRVGASARAVAGLPTVQQARQDAERALAGRGRVVLRASGTEPLVRVTVEAQAEQEVNEHAEALAALVLAEASKLAACRD